MSEVDREPLLVVIPAFNEAATIAEVVTQSSYHADVCVVDDGSADDTAAIAGSVAGTHVIRLPRNRNITAALLEGFRYARDKGYPRCITMDAGLSHDPGLIPEFYKYRKDDLVIGARTRKVDTPAYRQILSWGARTLTNLALERRFMPWGGAGLQDTTSGYRMYSRRAYELLLRAPLKSRSFDFHLEALAYVYRAGLEIREVPVSYRFSNSSLRPRIVADALKTCARLWTEDFRIPETRA